MSLELNDLESGLTEAQSARKNLLKERAAIADQIKEKQMKLDDLAPEFSKFQSLEISAKERYLFLHINIYRLVELEFELEHLSSKQGRHDRFKNALERDAWIKSSIKEMKAALDITANQLLEANKSRDGTQKEETDLKIEIESLKKRLTGRRALLDVIDKEFLEVKERKEELELERK